MRRGQILTCASPAIVIGIPDFNGLDKESMVNTLQKISHYDRDISKFISKIPSNTGYFEKQLAIITTKKRLYIFLPIFKENTPIVDFRTLRESLDYLVRIVNQLEITSIGIPLFGQETEDRKELLEYMVTLLRPIEKQCDINIIEV